MTFPAPYFRRSVNEGSEEVGRATFETLGAGDFFPPHLQTHYPDVTALEKGPFFHRSRRLVGNVLFTGPTGLPINTKKKGKEKGKTREPISPRELFNTEWPLLLRADGEVC